MRSSETGAEFELKDTLFHQGERLVVRPDVKEQLQEGNTVVHLAEVGADFVLDLEKSNRRRSQILTKTGRIIRHS